MELVVDYTPAYYDTLPTVEIARGKLAEKEDLLPALGQIIVKYGLEKDFGVTLLHRHDGSSKGLANVRIATAGMALASEFKPSDGSLAPVQWRLVPHDGGMSFAPVEFLERKPGEPDKVPLPNMSDHENFLKEMRELLVKENAEDVFGVSSLAPMKMLGQENVDGKLFEYDWTPQGPRVITPIAPTTTGTEFEFQALWTFSGTPGGPPHVNPGYTCYGCQTTPAEP